MDWAALGIAAAKALTPVAMALGAYLATAAATWLRAHATNTATATALSVIDGVVRTVVAELEQTVVPDLKAAAAKGSLTADDAGRIKNQALTVIKSYLGQKGIKAVVDALKLDDAGLTKLVSSKIEATVYNMNHPEQTGLPAFTVSPEYAAKLAGAH